MTFPVIIRIVSVLVLLTSFSWAVDVPEPAAVKNAEKTFRDLFAKDYAAVSKSKNPAEKVAFAKKLWESATGTPNDPSIAWVFAEKAFPLAMSDPSGYAIALEMKQYRVEPSGKNRPSQLLAVADVLDKSIKTATPDKRGKLTHDMIDVYRDLAETYFVQSRDSDVAASLGKAREAAKTLVSTEAAALAKELTLDKEGFDAIRKHQSEQKAAATVLKANASDPRANAVMAFCMIRTGHLTNFLPHLRASKLDALQKLADALEKPSDDPLTLGDAWRSVAEAHPQEKLFCQGQARRAYDTAASAQPKHPNTGRAKLIARELPPFRAVNVRPPSPSFAMELLDEPETFEGTLTLWTKAGGTMSFTRADRWNGDAALKFSPGRQGGNAAFSAVTAATPTLGQYRFVRFAWKQNGGSHVRIEFLSKLQQVNVYNAGKPTPETQVKVSDNIPKDWTVVTRDLVADRINNYAGTELLTFDGLRIDTDGVLLLDGVWLGRSLKDLDRVLPRPLE